MNTVDLGQLYSDAQGNTKPELKRTRYQVDEHGELAAVLVPKAKGKLRADRDQAHRSVRNERKAPVDAGRDGDVGPRGDAGGKPPAEPPTPTTGFADFSDDEWQNLIDHAWQRHAPDAHLRGETGTKLPVGTTREEFEHTIAEILSRERVVAPHGLPDPGLVARLDAGEVTLAEQRNQFVDLYARAGDVRYEIRMAGRKSTAHPIDGVGVVRHVSRHGEVRDVALPLGSRPVEGWDIDKKSR